MLVTLTRRFCNSLLSLVSRLDRRTFRATHVNTNRSLLRNTIIVQSFLLFSALGDVEAESKRIGLYGAFGDSIEGNYGSWHYAALTNTLKQKDTGQENVVEEVNLDEVDTYDVILYGTNLTTAEGDPSFPIEPWLVSFVNNGGLLVTDMLGGKAILANGQLLEGSGSILFEYRRHGRTFGFRFSQRAWRLSRGVTQPLNAIIGLSEYYLRVDRTGPNVVTFGTIVGMYGQPAWPAARWQGRAWRPIVDEGE